MNRLSAEEIRAALSALAEELAPAPAPAELFVLGGAALVVQYQARSATKDVDVFIGSSGREAEFRSAAARVAARLGLPTDWLNDAAKGYLKGLDPGSVLVEHPTLRVRAISDAQLLAMKLSAWRDDVDVADARLLLARLEGDRTSIWNRVEPFLVPGRELKARYAFEDLWEVEHGSD